MKSPMRINAILLAIALLASVSGCRKEDIKEIEIKFNQPIAGEHHNAGAALGRFRGIQSGSLIFDDKKRTMRLRYDSMQLARINILMALEEKGFSVVYPTNSTGKAGYINER